jgi:molybdopterin-guanine dinucleotide biosynthesis protein A
MAELAAAITAGGRVDGAFAARIGTDVKALAPWKGGALIDTSLAAARAVGASRLAVVGSPAVLAHCAGRIDQALDEAPTGEQNLRTALASAGDRALLFLTSDMPFVDGPSLIDFLSRAGDAEAAMPLAEARDYESAYPNSPEHVTRIGGELVAGGSAFFFGPGVARRVEEVATRLFSARKSLWGMATLLGPRLLVMFALRLLRIEDIERRADRVLGLRARAVRHAAPQLCYDVDTIEEYDYALGRIADA